MASDPHKRRSIRQATTRKRSLYLDPDTDDDFTLSDHDKESAAGEHAPSPEPAPKKARQAVKRPNRPLLRSASAAKKPPSKKSPPKHPKPKDPTKLTKQVQDATPTIPSDGIIPKWQTLPYEILVQIFTRAFEAEKELENGTVASRRAHHPNTWIMKTARRVCREFAEPAVNAFYRSPNLLAPRWLDDLAALVHDDKHLFPYHMKVRRLELSARHLDSVVKEKPSLLADLVVDLPQLSSLIITHPLDEAPFEYQGRLPRWKYPVELFDALDRANIRLDSWRWNVQLVEHDDATVPQICEIVKSIHKRTAFHSLRHLSVANLPAVEALEPETDTTGVTLGHMLDDLTNLKSLSFESCDCISSAMLLELPPNLESIKFVNCMSLHSDMLVDFLTKNGHSLKELILNHNPFLDLAFLTGLRSTCPQLRVLKMDLYDHRENYFRHFAEPKYESLLLEDEIPAWPTSMQVLELVHLQKWGANAAQNLFRSLVDSAESLPNLRRLVLQAHINISWRDRAAFRDQWIERLRRVYQRYPTAPSATLASLRAFRQWKKSQLPSVQPRSPSLVEVLIRRSSLASHTSDNESLSKRRSKRIAVQETVLPPPPVHAEKPTRGRRRQGRRTSDAISVASEGQEQEGEDWRNKAENFVQGLCDVVDIRIDNQRPREEQLNESHFLDSEASGDEEWTEGAEVDADEYAW